MSDKTIGIIHRPKFGVGDRGTACLAFEVYVSESSAALQILSVEDTAKVLEAYGVDDVAKLDGKPCWVEATTGMIKWVGPLVIR